MFWALFLDLKFFSNTEAYLKPCQTSTLKCCCGNSKKSTPSVFDSVLNTPRNNLMKISHSEKQRRVAINRRLNYF